MRIKVEQCYSNGWRGKTNNTQFDDIETLNKKARDNYNAIKEELIKDPKIKVEEFNPRTLNWNDASQHDTPFEQVRAYFYIIKNGRTQLTENDIYKTVNKHHVSYFRKI